MGQVPAIGDDHEFGIPQLAGRAYTLLCRDDAVVVAGYNQDGQLSQTPGAPSYVVPQHQFFGIGIKVYLPVHPFGHRWAAEVMLE